ncbi:unnamed protein product [Rhizophagus irregularis]|nr:unnamed protein product [Rhizophagus irregularis]
MIKLLTISRKVYLVSPKDGEYEEYNSDDWTATTAATLIPSTQKVYITTSFNNLWEISLNERKAKKLVGMDFLGGFMDVWTRVNAAAVVGQNIFVTTSANNLWCIDSTGNEEPKKLGGGSDNWSTCKALVAVDDKLIAFCYGLWEVNIQNGNSTPFFDDNSDDAKRSWSSVRSATVIGHNIYVINGSQLLELDTINKNVREISNDDWGYTKAIVAIEVTE